MTVKLFNKNNKYQMVSVHTDEDTNEQYVILKEIDSTLLPTRMVTAADYLGKGK